MTLPGGTRLGPYEILASLGAGGALLRLPPGERLGSGSVAGLPAPPPPAKRPLLTPDRRLMAATVRLHEATAEVLDTKPLFSNKDFRLGWDPRVRTTYEVSADGRFLFPLPVDERDARPIVAVVDWAASVEKR